MGGEQSTSPCVRSQSDFAVSYNSWPVLALTWWQEVAPRLIGALGYLNHSLSACPCLFLRTNLSWSFIALKVFGDKLALTSRLWSTFHSEREEGLGLCCLLAGTWACVCQQGGSVVILPGCLAPRVLVVLGHAVGQVFSWKDTTFCDTEH